MRLKWPLTSRGRRRTGDEQNGAAHDAWLYSLGTLAGAGVGMALTALGIAANVHILLAALVCIIPILTGIRAIPAGTGQHASDEQKSAAKGCPSIVISS